MKRALLVLENGYHEQGIAFSGEGTVFSEFIFNTSMVGYEKIITDPSYREQTIVFTYPLIGNYGINEKFFESKTVHASGIIIREYNDFYSHYTAKKSLKELLNENGVFGVSEVDTRELTINIRKYGSIKGGISTEILDKDSLLRMVKESPPIEEKNPVEKVVDKKTVKIKGNTRSKEKLLILNFGIKKSIIENLKKFFGELILSPYKESLYEELDLERIDGIFLSNGPGDPRRIKNIENFIRIASSKKIPILGICFGHQLVGKAFGLEIVKLPFGHHGGNHPVKNLKDNKVYITAQNHNYAISLSSIEKSEYFEVSWINLFDNTVEGMIHRELPIYTVQFHPEASPGPNDAKELVFETMYNLVKEKNAQKR